nr:uncharacterized protein LOC121119272 [Lepeophtheirus salmonis]
MCCADIFWKVTYHTGLSDTHITSIFAKSLKWLEFETANGPFNKNSMFINFSIGDGFFKQKKKFTIGKTFILNQPFSTEPLTIKVSWDPNKENLVFSYSTNKGDVIWKCSKNDRGINLIGKRRKNEPHARLSMKRIYSTNDEDGAKS